MGFSVRVLMGPGLARRAGQLFREGFGLRTRLTMIKVSVWTNTDLANLPMSLQTSHPVLKTNVQHQNRPCRRVEIPGRKETHS